MVWSEIKHILSTFVIHQYHSIQQSKSAKLWLSIGWLITALMLLGLYFLSLSPDYSAIIFKTFFREDGLLETISALLYFITALVLIMAAKAKSLHSPLNRYNSVWCLFLAALFFVVGGEEISWGQRIFDISTPAALNEINLQSEMNLHNIDGIHQHIRVVAVVFVLILCYFIPLSYRNHFKLRSLYQRYSLPIFPLHGLMPVTIAILYMLIPRLLLNQSVFELDEIGEFYLSVAWVLFAVKHWASYQRRLLTVDTVVSHSVSTTP